MFPLARGQKQNTKKLGQLKQEVAILGLIYLISIQPLLHLREAHIIITEMTVGLVSAILRDAVHSHPAEFLRGLGVPFRIQLLQKFRRHLLGGKVSGFAENSAAKFEPFVFVLNKILNADIAGHKLDKGKALSVLASPLQYCR